MRELISGYGRTLVTLFFVSVVGWIALMIVGPQLTVLETSLERPLRQLDSSIATALARDAGTCRTILERQQPSASGGRSTTGGLAVPSFGGSASSGASNGGLPVPSLGGSTTGGGAAVNGGLAVPSLGGGGLAVPIIGGTGASAIGGAAPVRPYILQCDRARTDVRLVRGNDAGDEVTLAGLYGAEVLRVDNKAAIATQLEQADAVRAIAEELAIELRRREADAFPYGWDNYLALAQPREIPLSPEAQRSEAAEPWNQLLTVLGIRYVEDGRTFVRLGLATLLMTLVYAMAATALALVICYPIAFNLALASTPEKAVWLFLGLLIPYAIVELMRVYAWVSILENDGLLNRFLQLVGFLDATAQQYVPFKRYPATIFVVIVYTYILFMVFPLVNVMSTLDRAQLEAARDLGASTWKLHTRIVIPHAKPGIAVGCIATFMLCAGAFSVPRIISRGLQSEWFTQTIYNKFFESQNANVGSAYAFAYTLMCFIIVGLFMWAMRARLKDFLRA